MRGSKWSSASAVALGLIWIGGVPAGFWHLSRYETTAGEPVRAPDIWPRSSTIALDQSRPTLVMLVHPRCPCTRASLAELDRLMARCEGRVAAQVLFLDPSEHGDEWVQTDLWWHVEAIPGVQAVRDTDGREARLFGVSTSGSVVLYGPDRRLRFRGGITGSRGHAGDNAGESALTALLRNETPIQDSTPVYGCSLTDEFCENR